MKNLLVTAMSIAFVASSAQAANVNLDRIATCQAISAQGDDTASISREELKQMHLSLFADVSNWQGMGCAKDGQAMVAIELNNAVLEMEDAMETALLPTGQIKLPGYGARDLSLTLVALNTTSGFVHYSQLYGKLDAGKDDQMSATYRIYEKWGPSANPHDVRVQLRCKVNRDVFSQRNVSCPE